MEYEADLFYDSLMKWMSTFPVSSVRDSAESLCDGVAMAQILHIIDPDNFDSSWVGKVVDVGDNKRLRLNNLRKVLTGTLDFLKEVGMQLSSFSVPDINEVVECEKSHLARLIQLILGVAINCSNRGEHIQRIQKMDFEVQQVIVKAIQELPDIASQSLQTPLDDTAVRKMMEEMEETRTERETLAQKCYELEMQLNLLKEEKTNLSSEFENLQAQLGTKGEGGAPVDSGIRLKEIKHQNETLKQELETMEAQKDDIQLKLEETESRLEESEEKLSEIQKRADQYSVLKDENDILRENSDKVVKYEAIIETYKKKLDEMGDLKRQIKYLEDKNAEYLESNMKLEDDLGKVSKKQPATEIFRKQIQELQTKLTSQTERADKVSFENNKLMEKLEAISTEKDRLAVEREQLKEQLEETKYPKVENTSPEFSQFTEEPDSGMLENIPPSVKARLFRLEKENQQLKKYKTSTASVDDSDTRELQVMIQDMVRREEEVTNKNRELNMKLMELEANNKELQTSSVPRVPGSREELELKVAEASKKITQLTETLQKKDAEINRMEERYKKYIDKGRLQTFLTKAKSVIKTLDPKHNPNAAPEVSALKVQLEEKDKVIEGLERETEKAKAIREMEERLMASAFYDLSMKLHRGAVEDRLKNLSQGQSFIARQRQVNTRKGVYNGSQPEYFSNYE